MVTLHSHIIRCEFEHILLKPKKCLASAVHVVILFIKNYILYFTVFFDYIRCNHRVIPCKVYGIFLINGAYPPYRAASNFSTFNFLFTINQSQYIIVLCVFLLCDYISQFAYKS